MHVGIIALILEAPATILEQDILMTTDPQNVRIIVFDYEGRRICAVEKKSFQEIEG